MLRFADNQIVLAQEYKDNMEYMSKKLIEELWKCRMKFLGQKHTSIQVTMLCVNQTFLGGEHLLSTAVFITLIRVLPHLYCLSSAEDSSNIFTKPCTEQDRIYQNFKEK